MGGSEQKLTGPDLKTGVSIDSLKPGERILGHADGIPALLIRDGEEFFAVGALCSHYGANLNDGILVGKTLRCPWHHACFDIKTGEATKAPALNPVPTWNVEVKDGRVFVRDRKLQNESSHKAISKEHFVVIGSGAAGHAAAEMLRRKGFSGALTILSEDQELPYDRPNLSKDYLAGTAPEEWMSLRSEEFYKSKDILLRLNTKVLRLDLTDRKITLLNGENVRFDKCLLATGGTPNRPEIAGIDLPHVHFLRSFSDCKKLIGDLAGKKKIAIIGAGFIGLEAAAALKARGLEVTVIAPHALPLSRVVGDEIGALIKLVHEKNGVRFRLNRSVEMIDQSGVILSDGAREQADVILMATGIVPNVELASNAGIKCDNGVLVNQFLETSAPDIFAAGDIARWPDPFSRNSVRVEHWVVAQRQGQVAALNMLGLKEAYADIPFFWTMQFDLTLNYIGHASSWAKTEVRGNLDEKNFSVAFYENDTVSAVITVGRDQQNLLIEEAMQTKNQKRIKELLQQ